MKKIILLFLFSCLLNLFSYADPCTSIQQISCGDTVQFSSMGIGDPAYPNGMNGQGCTLSSGQGGQETIYRYVVPATGTYQFNNITTSGTYVDYYYKRNNTACTNTGWSCIGSNISPGTSLGAYNWNVGDTILFLLNAESTGTATQSFKINCATNLCNVIRPIVCGDTVLFSSFGYGDPAYPNGLNGQGCTLSGGPGGQESIYRFVVPATGTYQLNTAAGSNSYVDYYYKRNSTACTNTGWSCIGSVLSPGTSLGAYNWNVGDTILFLLNAEVSSGTVTQSFKINCATNLCNVIRPMVCGDTVLFNSFGYGDPTYPNGLNGQGCTLSGGPGGQETIYRFVVPTTGTFQLINITTNNSYVDYYYKRNNTACISTGWSCIGSVGSNVSPGTSLGTYNWNAGDTILFLLNAESSSGTVTQSFKICCNTTCTSLPLSLTIFQAIVKENQVNLMWRTSQEQGTQNFVIERSSNQTNFLSIGIIAAANYSSIIKDYSFIDKYLLQGNTYYRLKMFDKDGKFTYSKIISVKLSNITSAELYPNPVTTTATIKFQSQHTENVEVKIVSSDGKILSTKIYKLTAGNNLIELNTQRLTSGVYAVIIAGQNINEHLTFSKQ